MGLSGGDGRVMAFKGEAVGADGGFGLAAQVWADLVVGGGSDDGWKRRVADLVAGGATQESAARGADIMG